MKKIICVARIGLGVAMVLMAAYSLSSFGGALDLTMGTSLMLLGVIIGVFLEKHYDRFFFLISSFSLLLTLSLHFFPFLPNLQYLMGGLLVYFACATVFGRKITATTV